MTAIYRYEVPVDDQPHRIRLFGEIVHVGGRRMDSVEFWALHSEGGDSNVLAFLVVGTGHPLPSDFIRHVGTHVAGSLVWHLVEVAP